MALLRWLVIVPVLSALLVVSNVAAQRRLDAIKEERLEEELLYLPNEKLLNHFTAGLSSVIADLIWLRTIQYTSKEFHNQNRKFTWLEHMVNTATRLDPLFEGVYANGGMLLAAIGADDAALKILRRGVTAVPNSHEIPGQIFQIYVLNRRLRPESPVLATHYLRMMAERTPRREHAEYYYRLIHGMQRLHNLEDQARWYWEDILAHTKDPLTIEIGRQALLDLTIRGNLKKLEEIVELFEKENGRKPENIEELVSSGLLDRLPEDPGHGRYFLDSKGAVKNTVVLDAQVERIRNWLTLDAAAFKKEYGHFPQSLEEWSTARDLPIPDHPYEDRVWSYDPATGTLR